MCVPIQGLTPFYRISTNSQPNRTGSRRIDVDWSVDVGNDVDSCPYELS